jgi:hypothetical protein
MRLTKYGLECWAIDRKIEHSMSFAELKMLRWIGRVTRKDEIKNEYVRGSIDVVSIVNKMRENRLRWFGHVMRREETNTVKNCYENEL